MFFYYCEYGIDKDWEYCVMMRMNEYDPEWLDHNLRWGDVFVVDNKSVMIVFLNCYPHLGWSKYKGVSTKISAKS